MVETAQVGPGDLVLTQGCHFEARTGAVARRDVGTVRVHARSLTGVADAVALYRTLAEQILAATPGRGKEDEIRAVLREAERSPEANEAVRR